MAKSNIDWRSMTSEEIFHKKTEFINTYEMMKKMIIEMDDRMMEIEDAFKEAEEELANRGVR
jgi:hypothetical protein